MRARRNVQRCEPTLRRWFPDRAASALRAQAAPPVPLYPSRAASESASPSFTSSCRPQRVTGGRIPKPRRSGPLLRPSTRYPSRGIQADLLLLRHRRLVERPRIARAPAAGVDEREKVVGNRVEEPRLLVCDEMARAGYDHQARGGTG